jgi:hypothetical protein
MKVRKPVSIAPRQTISMTTMETNSVRITSKSERRETSDGRNTGLPGVGNEMDAVALTMPKSL